jgi:hypothetical protein
LHKSSSACQRHFLRAARCIVSHADCAVEYALVLRIELDVIVQLALGLRLLGQLFVWWNEPVTLMWLIFRTPAPVFVSLTCCAGLVVKTTWSGNVRLGGEKVTPGDVPTPVSGID